MILLEHQDYKSRAKLTKYGKLLDVYLQREDTYKENKAKLFAVIYGQCTPKMVAGLKSRDGFKEKESTKDVVWLMEVVNKLSVEINEYENEAVTAYDATKHFYDLRQLDGKSIDRFRDRFDESWKTADL